MSIATTVMRVRYQGDGSTTSFTFPFKINAAGDIKVLLYDSVAKTVSEITSYTLTPNGTTYPSLGGTISGVTAPTATQEIIIERNMDILQNDTYQYGDTLNLDNLERSFDTLVMQQQQNVDKADRSIKLAENVDIANLDLRIPSPKAHCGFCWDATAKKFVGIDLSKIVAGAGIGDMLKSTYDTDDNGIVDNAEACAGNASTATQLQTARTIGGVSFNGTANIDLPGVNKEGNQDTSGTAAKATGDKDGNDITTTYEKYLNNPPTDGYILSSTAAGVRSWISGSENNGNQTFSTPGTYTWTCPVGVTSVLATVIGAGGGGAGGAYLNNTTICPNGGGGGNIIRDCLISVTPGTNYAITVGAGGNGGAATENGASGINFGSNGGTSSFGSILYASGGLADGTGAFIYGYSGTSQLPLNSGQSQTIGEVGGRGGGPFGGAGGNNSTPPGNGGLGSGGGGAAGKYDNNTPSVKTGGNGGPGMVIIKY